MGKKPKLLIITLGSLSFMSIVFVVTYQYIFNNSSITLGKYKGKVLIMAIKASGGHMAAANALKARLGRDGYVSDIFILDDYDFLRIGPLYDYAIRSPMGRVMMNLSAPFYWMTGRYYFMGLTFILEHWLMVGEYGCIVSVMPMTYKAINYALDYIGKSIPMVIIPTDLEEPWSGFWLDGQNAFYLLGSQQLLDQATHLVNQFRISGMLLRSEFTEDVKPKEERREELGLPKSSKVVLVLFGACGSSDMEIIAELMATHTEYHFVFVCGKGAKIQQALQKIQLQHNANYTILGFVSDIHKWMQAADVCIGKPGPGVMSECVASKLPMIFRDSFDVLRQERCVLKHVVTKKYGEVVHSWPELPDALKLVMTNHGEYYARLTEVPKNNALDEACKFIKQRIA